MNELGSNVGSLAIIEAKAQCLLSDGYQTEAREVGSQGCTTMRSQGMLTKVHFFFYLAHSLAPI